VFGTVPSKTDTGKDEENNERKALSDCKAIYEDYTVVELCYAQTSVCTPSNTGNESLL
jgi:hypothetical protein